MVVVDMIGAWLVRLSFGALAIGYVLLSVDGLAQAPQAPAPEAEAVAQQVFRIGYIRQDPEAVTSEAVFDRLRKVLSESTELQRLMAETGVGAVRAQSFENHRLLIEAMDAEQVDLAFCTALDFAFQRGNYEPVLQQRRRGDSHSSVGGGRVWHSGVIIAGRGSPLFNMETSAALRALPDHVMKGEMAMVGSSSAAGYVYPYLTLAQMSSSSLVMRARSLFWDSSSEVVKAVVNGVHGIGACDAMAVDETLKAYGLLEKKDLLVRELIRTDPVPRDPVVLHSRWIATDEGSVENLLLGRAVVRLVQSFFESDPSLPRLERTTQQPFVEVKQNLERFETLKRQATGQAE